MSLMRALVFVICIFSSAQFAAAQEQGADAGSFQDPIEVVVSGTRSEMPREEEASAITVVSGEEMERKQETSVADALREVPGVDVVRSGGLGGNTSVFLRGANPEHTLVLIDGIEANNPITPSRVFNFADLTSENIERIEVLRGPQSTLYGSDAMGGVVNIITKKGEGAPTAYASSEGGSYDTFTERVGLRGGDGYPQLLRIIPQRR